MKKSIFLILTFILFACSSKMVRFEQYSVSMNLKVAADSSVTIGDDEKFYGILWLNPIMKAENTKTEKVKLIQNYGKYFVCADQFKNIWMIEPEEDGVSGEYKPIDVTPDDKTDAYSEIGLSRYGSKDKTCVKFRFNKKEVFIDMKGKVHEKCEK